MRPLFARGVLRPFGSSSFSRKALSDVICGGLLLAAGIGAPLSAQPAPSDPVQVPAAKTAYRDTIAAPIAPPSIPAPVKIEGAAAPATEASATQSRIVVNAVTFSGNTRFSSEALASLVAGDLGKALSFEELQALAAKVERHYHAAGYFLTRVVIPQQDIGEKRTLELRVLEGWLEQINVTSSPRFKEERVRRALQNDIRIGQPFKVSDLERSLAALNKNSGISVGSTLKAGEQPGATVIDVEVTEERRVSGSIEANNFGSKNTGEYRIIPAVALPNFTGRGDQLSLFGVFSPEVSDLYFAQVNYVTPLNVHGTSANLYYSQGNYQVGREFEVLEIEGDNSAWGVGLSQDVVLSAKTGLTFELWLESSDMEQTMLGAVSSRDEIRKIRLGANVDVKDMRGRTFASLHVHQGLGEALGGMDDDSVLSSRAFGGADNDFTKLVATVTRLQSLHPRLFALLHVAGQYAFESVVAGEQFAIGGANSVRGHPQSAFSGDDGFVINAELRFSVLPEDNRYQLAAFFDHGQVRTKKPIIGQDTWNRISGAGVGGRAVLFDDLELRLDLAAPVGTKTEDSFYAYAQVRYRF